jgi:hypothetical protein
VYFREDNVGFKQHQEMIASVTKSNPFWLFSDMVKLEQKDCQALLESIDYIDILAQRRQ